MYRMHLCARSVEMGANGRLAQRLIKVDNITTRTSHYESLTTSGAGYILNVGVTEVREGGEQREGRHADRDVEPPGGPAALPLRKPLAPPYSLHTVY